MLKIDKLSFKYEQTIILDKISFVIPRKEIVALAGPNGSGKTTLIKNIMNLLEKESGCIVVNNQTGVSIVS